VSPGTCQERLWRPFGIGYAAPRQNPSDVRASVLCDKIQLVRQVEPRVLGTSSAVPPRARLQHRYRCTHLWRSAHDRYQGGVYGSYQQGRVVRRSEYGGNRGRGSNAGLSLSNWQRWRFGSGVSCGRAALGVRGRKCVQPTCSIEWPPVAARRRGLPRSVRTVRLARLLKTRTSDYVSASRRGAGERIRTADRPLTRRPVVICLLPGSNTESLPELGKLRIGQDISILAAVPLRTGRCRFVRVGTVLEGRPATGLCCSCVTRMASEAWTPAARSSSAPAPGPVSRA
jgi:hypothetical protein